MSSSFLRPRSNYNLHHNESNCYVCTPIHTQLYFLQKKGNTPERIRHEPTAPLARLPTRWTVLSKGRRFRTPTISIPIRLLPTICDGPFKYSTLQLRLLSCPY
eukprot:2941354-Pyramimonas_sp.AAC.1